MFAQIKDTEIQRLAELKASGLATQIYLVLAAHDWGKGKCFPSLTRICEMLSGTYHRKSVLRSLKWLEDNGLIQRQEATSKERFTMLLRKTKEAVTKLFQGEPIGDHKRERKRMKNYRSSKTHRKSKSEELRERKLKEVSNWLQNISDTRLLKEAVKTDQDKPWFESLKMEADSMSYPTRKPQNCTDLEVLEAIKASFHGSPKESWLWDFWTKLPEPLPA